MLLKKLATHEMLALSGRWVTKGEAANAALLLVPEAAGLVPRLEAAHKKLLKTQRREDPRVEELIEQAAALDVEHDDLARGLDSLCRMMSYLAEPAQRSGWERVREALFPDGLAIINQSYTAEAGNAVRVAALLEGVAADDRQLLKEVTLGKKTAQQVVALWLKAAARLGDLESQRQAIQGAGASQSEVQAARQEWVRVTNALVAMADMSGRAGELAPYLQTPLTEADRRAARRTKTPPAEEPLPGATPQVDP